MIVRLVRQDQMVMVDGISIQSIDFSDVNSDIWAVRWDSEAQVGEIEWEGSVRPNESVTSEAEVDSALGVPLMTMLNRRQTILDNRQAEDDAQAASEAAAMPNLPDWEANRLDEYPSLPELIVALYDTDDRASIDARRAAVKAKWPKDDSGPVE